MLINRLPPGVVHGPSPDHSYIILREFERRTLYIGAYSPNLPYISVFPNLPYNSEQSGLFLDFLSSRLLSSPYFSSSLPFVAQIWGHIVGTPPPSPLRCVPFNFLFREDLRGFFPRRIASNCACTRWPLSQPNLCTRKKGHSVGLELAKSSFVVRG